MQFRTDKQTLDDLNIFGKPGADSVYTRFNETKTQGGASILEELFRYPLSRADEINERKEMIRFFALNNAIRFPFQTAHFDAIEPYLENQDERTKLSAGSPSLGDRFNNLIGKGADAEMIVSGLTALIGVLKTLKTFIASEIILKSEAYKRHRESISVLFSASSINSLLENCTTEKLSQGQLSACDAVLRFREKDTARKLLAYIYKLDVYIAVATVASKEKYSFPLALPAEEHVVKLNGMFHPLLKNPVPNSLQLSADKPMLFLTGANMAGKSTFMKSLGITLFLAHMGFPVPAGEMDFSVLDGMYTTINLSDDLEVGASHFYAEVLRIKKIAKELGKSKNLFVIFDELFRGTNVMDAHEATIALTSAFAKKRNSLFVISTHIVEAGEELMQQSDSINFVYLPTKMNGTHPVYTYTLEQGITSDRHGMIIINNEGILDILEKGLDTKAITS